MFKISFRNFPFSELIIVCFYLADIMPGANNISLAFKHFKAFQRYQSILSVASWECHYGFYSWDIGITRKQIVAHHKTKAGHVMSGSEKHLHLFTIKEFYLTILQQSYIFWMLIDKGHDIGMIFREILFGVS